METILISFSICILGVFAAVLLFSVAMRGPGEKGADPTQARPPLHAERFFLTDSLDQGSPADNTSDALLLQLDRHFRLEERAAALFLEGPSTATLHAPSASPLWQ